MHELVPLTMKEKDDKNDKWSRSMPAYVCLAFPVTMFFMYAFNNADNLTGNLWIYVALNIAGFSTICPAMFFLYKMVIRDISKLITSTMSCIFRSKGEESRSHSESISYMKYYTRDDNILFEYEIFYTMYRNLTGGLLVNFPVIYLANHFIFQLSNIHLVYWADGILALIGALLAWKTKREYDEALTNAYNNKQRYNRQELGEEDASKEA